MLQYVYTVAKFVQVFMTRCIADINECVETLCGSNEVCVDTVGSYTCSCREGYERSRDGQHCTSIKRKFPVAIVWPIIINYNTPSLSFQQNPMLFNPSPTWL